MRHQLMIGTAIGLAAACLGFLPLSMGASKAVALNSNCTCQYDNGPGEVLASVPSGCGALNVMVIYASARNGLCAHSGCSGPAANCVATASVLVESSGGCFIEFFQDTKLVAFAHDALGIRIEDNIPCEDFVDWFVNIAGVPVVRITNICQDCPGA